MEEREKFLMKDVKGWEYGSVYNADKFVPSKPQFCLAEAEGVVFTNYLMFGWYRFVRPTYVVTPAKAEKPVIPIRVT